MAVGAVVLMDICQDGFRIGVGVIFMTHRTIGSLQEDRVRITMTAMLGNIIVAMTHNTSGIDCAGNTIGNGIIHGGLQWQPFRIGHGRGIILMAQGTAVAQAVMQGIDIRHGYQGAATWTANG